MKRITALVLTVLLTFMATAAFAVSETWICPVCGFSSTGNFCSNCGGRKPASSGSASSGSASASTSAISNIRFESLRNGNVRVTWSASGNGPFYVNYTMPSWNSRWRESESYPRTSAVIKHLVPGQRYEFTVSDGSAKASAYYTVPSGTFSELLTNRKLTMDRTTFDLGNGGIHDTFQLRFYFPQLRSERRYSWTLALKTPLGYSSRVILDENFAMQPKISYYYWNFAIEGFMNRVEEDFGEIPSGYYTFEAYLDGQYYAGVDFYVYGR